MTEPTEIGLPTGADAWRCVLCRAVVVTGEAHGCPVELRIREIVREEMDKRTPWSEG